MLSRNVVHAALYLLTSLLGVAGLYVILLAEFLALVQVLVYGGAITIVLLFAIMLTRSREFPFITDNPQKLVAAVTASAIFVTLTAGLISSSPLASVPQSTSLKRLGTSLFTEWAIPFEIASVVLLVALIGAIVIARDRGSE